MKTKSHMFLVAVATASGLAFAAVAQEASQDPNLSGQQSQSQSTEASPSAASPSSSPATPSTSSAASSSSQQLQDGLVKHEGTVKFIKNGQVQKVDKELKLSEGITVQPNGDVELKDGTKMTLQEGQMVTLDSQVTTIPPEAMKTLKESHTEDAPRGSEPAGGTSSGAAGSGGSTTTEPLE